MANTNDEAEWDTGAPEHLTTSPESGLHLAPAALMARIQEALTTSSRTEAALADLSRTAQFLCATVSAGLPYRLRARSRARSATGHARRPRGNEHRPLRFVVGSTRRVRAVRSRFEQFPAAATAHRRPRSIHRDVDGRPRARARGFAPAFGRITAILLERQTPCEVSKTPSSSS